MTTAHRAADSRGILLSAPLPYAALLAAVQCLALARDTRSEAEPLRADLWPFMESAGHADPQQARVPCDVLRAATHCLRAWRAAAPAPRSPLWSDADDAALTAAWRDGLTATT
ncbi:hypothetical protein OG693_39825 [Streptomyces sp. NBC_01259]|uniref:hypothetical protein n=1 Tax=Streptomyces sp. NBC_01259 TaxID=2903800 RepID=UPI0032522C1B